MRRCWMSPVFVWLRESRDMEETGRWKSMKKSQEQQNKRKEGQNNQKENDSKTRSQKRLENESNLNQCSGHARPSCKSKHFNSGIAAICFKKSTAAKDVKNTSGTKKPSKGKRTRPPKMPKELSQRKKHEKTINEAGKLLDP